MPTHKEIEVEDQKTVVHEKTEHPKPVVREKVESNPKKCLQWVLLAGGSFRTTLRSTEKIVNPATGRAQTLTKPVICVAKRSGLSNVGFIDVLRQDSVVAKNCTPEEFVELMMETTSYKDGLIIQRGEYDEHAAALRGFDEAKAKLEKDFKESRAAKIGKRGAVPQGPFAAPNQGGVTASTTGFS